MQPETEVTVPKNRSSRIAPRNERAALEVPQAETVRFRLTASGQSFATAKGVLKRLQHGATPIYKTGATMTLVVTADLLRAINKLSSLGDWPDGKPNVRMLASDKGGPVKRAG